MHAFLYKIYSIIKKKFVHYNCYEVIPSRVYVFTDTSWK